MSSLTTYMNEEGRQFSYRIFLPWFSAPTTATLKCIYVQLTIVIINFLYKNLHKADC